MLVDMADSSNDLILIDFGLSDINLLVSAAIL